MISCAWAQGTDCGSIGSSDETELQAVTNRRFYLNTANLAPCTGTITSWRVCYYGPDNTNILLRSRSRSYTASYSLYRRMGSGRDVYYQRVSNVSRAVITTALLADYDLNRTIVDDIIQNGFACFSDFNNIDLPLSVQAGDLVGACIFDPENTQFFQRRQLNIVSEVDGESLLGMSDVVECSVDDIPSSIRADQLSTHNNRRLHIYANIG